MLSVQICPGIIRTVDDFFTSENLKVNKIGDQDQKNSQKKVCNHREFPISSCFTRFRRYPPRRTATFFLLLVLIQIDHFDRFSDALVFPGVRSAVLIVFLFFGFLNGVAFFIRLSFILS